MEWGEGIARKMKQDIHIFSFKIVNQLRQIEWRKKKPTLKLVVQ